MRILPQILSVNVPEGLKGKKKKIGHFYTLCIDVNGIYLTVCLLKCIIVNKNVLKQSPVTDIDNLRGFYYKMLPYQRVACRWRC